MVKYQESQDKNKTRQTEPPRTKPQTDSKRTKVHPESEKAARATAEQFKQALIDLADR